jgi:hypothetical protein
MLNGTIDPESVNSDTFDVDKLMKRAISPTGFHTPPIKKTQIAPKIQPPLTETVMMFIATKHELGSLQQQESPLTIDKHLAKLSKQLRAFNGVILSHQPYPLM